MFEKEIKFISDFCLNKVKFLGAFFTYDKMAAADLHPAILRYVSAELDYMIYSDRKKILQQSYFDYSGKEISDHFRQIADEIKKTKKISFEDVKKLIIQAVSFNANFVVRPKWSLTKLIYNDQTSVPIAELEIMLSYIYYYDYIKNVLAAYLSKRKLLELSQTEFDLIFNKIDKELFKTNSEQLIDNALNSIGDFFNIGGVSKSRVSPLAIEILLKEKNLVEYLMKLRRVIPADEKKLYYIEDIKKVLYAVAPVEPESLTPVEEGEIKEEQETSMEETGEPEASIDEDTELESAIFPEYFDEPSLGEQAEEHAKELEKADMSDVISEEEDKLLEMYDKELEGGKEDESNVISDEVESTEDQVLESLIDGETKTEDLLTDEEEQKDSLIETEEVSAEKEIVGEMIKDYFEEDSETKAAEKEADETTPEKIDDAPVEEKKLESLEDELMEVFDEINRLDGDKEPGEAGSEEISESGSIQETDEVVIEEPVAEVKEIEEDEFEAIDKDLETVNEIAFGEDVAEESSDKIMEEQSRTEIEEPGYAEQELDKTEAEIKTDEADEEKFGPVVEREKDLFSYLKKKEIRKIIKNIFLKDEEDFVNTAEKIMQCPSYKGASEILKSVFSSYKVSPFSKEAVNFTNAVSNYFRQA